MKEIPRPSVRSLPSNQAARHTSLAVLKLFTSAIIPAANALLHKPFLSKTECSKRAVATSSRLVGACSGLGAGWPPCCPGFAGVHSAQPSTLQWRHTMSLSSSEHTLPTLAAEFKGSACRLESSHSPQFRAGHTPVSSHEALLHVL